MVTIGVLLLTRPEKYETIVITRKVALMPKNPYTLFEYQMNGSLVVSAIHILDLSKFLREHPDAKVKAGK
jgi:hypothetical protein